MKKVLLSVLGAGLLSLPIMASNCTPTGGNDCSSEADCTVEEHCHPTLNVCVSNCLKVDGACDAELGTSCSEEDIIEPIGGLAFNGICVCDPANDTCADGEQCNPYDLSCEMPCTEDAECMDYPSSQNRTCQDGFCKLPADDCRNDAAVCTAGTVCNPADGMCIAECTETSCTGGQVCNTSTHLCADACTAGSCASGEYCDDSRFGGSDLCMTSPTSCDQDTCLTNMELCNADNSSESYNLCIDADDVTNTCGAAGSRNGGPVIYVDDPSVDIYAVSGAEDPGQCTTNDKHLMAVDFMVEGGINAQEFTNTFWDDNGSWTAPYYTSQSVDGDIALLTVYMCFTSTGLETRGFKHINNGDSNTACVDFDI